MNKTYNSKSSIETNESQNNLSELNQNISLIYNIIFQNFKYQMLKQRFEFKKEVLTSTIFNNANLSPKKVKIDLNVIENLIYNLKNTFKRKRGGRFQHINKDDFTIFRETKEDKIDKYFKANTLNYNNKISVRKITIFIDTKFLRNFKGFENRINIKEKKELHEEDKEILRCEVCSAILPRAFINVNNQNKNSLIKRFYFKARKCWRYTSVIRNSNFSKSIVFDNIYKLIENINNCVKADDSSVADTARKIKTMLETAITKSQSLNLNTALIFQEFTNDLIKQIKMQIKHYNKLKKLEKITNDIHDAREEYTIKSSAFNNDLEQGKNSLISIKEFNFSITEKEEVFKLKSELSINGRNIANIDAKSLKFKQVIYISLFV